MTFAEVQRYPSHVMDETPRRYDPVTGEMVPITPYDFDFNRPLPEFRAPDVNMDDELLSAALEQLGRELGDPSLVAHSMFHNGTHLEGTDDKEPHNMNPVLFEDEYGRKIRGSMSIEDAYRPGLHDPEAIKRGDILDDSNMIEYTLSLIHI